jgi:hypothetical protein
MKKVFLGLFLTSALLTTGCLGNSEEQILGTWRYVHEINPSQHDMYWAFQDGGTVTFYNATTSQADTGKYEMFMEGTHRIVKIKGTTIKDNVLSMNGEWDIVTIDFDKLVVGTRDYGGFQQRDLTKQ